MHTLPSSPAKAGDPVSQRRRCFIEKPRRTGCRSIRPLSKTAAHHSTVLPLSTPTASCPRTSNSLAQPRSGHEDREASPDGRIDYNFCSTSRAAKPFDALKITCAKNRFRKRLNPIPPVQSCREKYSAFCFSEIDVPYSRPASHEGRFAIVTNVEAGCGGRCNVRRGLREDDLRCDGRPSRVVLASRC